MGWFKNLPHTVQEAFDLSIKTETQIQVADSFKMELNSNFTSMDINKISGRWQYLQWWIWGKQSVQR